MRWCAVVFVLGCFCDAVEIRPNPRTLIRTPLPAQRYTRPYLRNNVQIRPKPRTLIRPPLPAQRYTSPYQSTIPVMVHIDAHLTKKMNMEYGKRTRGILRATVRKIAKDVEGYFLHPTMNQRVNIKLLGTKFLRNISKVVTVSENATEYLKSYCQWQTKKKIRATYYSVLITGLDIYIGGLRNGVINRSSTGRGYMGGICSVHKSCTLLEWHPQSMSYLLAHEIAHSMGVAHDGPPFNRCKPRTHIMTPKYNPYFHPRSWSQCSRQSLKKYLRSQKSKCLQPASI